jgi:hypothetical protein
MRNSRNPAMANATYRHSRHLGVGFLLAMVCALAFMSPNADLAMALASTPVAPSITKQPASQTVAAGKTATFSVTAAGTTPLSYQWKKNSLPITGATSASYTTPATSAADSGSQFVVTVTNALGSVTSAAAALTVNIPPSITTQPAAQTVLAGQTATFSVVAAGTSPPTYQWKKNGSAIQGATLSSYTTPVTVFADNGASFTVTVTNVAANVTSSSAILTVNAPPTITKQPANSTVTAGQIATFSVTASGTTPLSYQWTRNSLPISGATSASYTTPATSGTDNGSQFAVTIINLVSTVTSAPATLTVNAPASITTQPANQTAFVGQTATFSVVGAGSGNLTYQWKKGGPSIKGATLSSYTTPVVTLSDSGSSFTVTVTNSFSSVTSSAAILTVLPAVPPAITSQPVSQAIVALQTATFSVAASGTPPFTYQWLKNGSGITGATSSSYTTPPMSIFDSGAIFSTRVTNAGGSATSAGAILTVNAPGQLTPSLSSLNFGNVVTQAIGTLTVSVTNSGGTSVTILNTTVSGAGLMASGGSGSPLAPGQSTSFLVTFAPETTGAVAGSLFISSTAANSPTTILLSGIGVAPGTHSVDLSWNETSTDVLGFNIYRATIPGGPYALVTAAPVTPSQYLDTQVTAGLSYDYVVTAVSTSEIESDYSAETSTQVPSP